ncbi:unnamed protein product, partial [Sphagnum jensenii]
MAKPWSGAGAWAAEAEWVDAQAKEREAFKGVGGQDAFAFPSLGDAATAKPKKKKGQTFSLSEITVGKYVGPGGKTRGVTDTAKLTTEEMMMLPTGPRNRSEDEYAEVGGLGGGFRDYGGNRGDRGDREEKRDRGGFGGGFAGGRGDRGGGYEEDRRSGRVSDRDLPSRADEVDNWGSSKKFVPSAPAGGDGYADRRISGRFEERRLSGGYDAPVGGPSRADEVDNWGKGKKFVATAAPTHRGSRFEIAFKDAGAEADRWARREPVREVEPRVSERPRLKLQPRTVPVDTFSPPPAPLASETNGEKVLHPVLDDPLTEEQHQSTQTLKPRPNPFGQARPREEVLAEKGQDWRKIDASLETHRESFRRPGSRPSSSHSSRGGGGVSSKPRTPEIGLESVANPRPRPNPFGEAMPREVLLEQKGKDWRILDVDLERHI